MTLAVVDRIRIEGPLAVVEIDHFDLDAYQLFLRCKKLPESQFSYDWRTDTYRVTTPARFAPLLGAAVGPVDADRLPLPEWLFDFQRYIVERALAQERFACWADTGLGKTEMQLEWARQVRHLTGQRVLILAPLAVIEQTREKARERYGEELEIERLNSREQLAAWCRGEDTDLAICNPEKFIPGQLSELRYLGGLAVDESSFLKTGGGVIKWNLIKSARGIRFKLSLTATPAPNDAMEYASQASFLEKLRTEGDILWTYFTRDKSGNWQVKPHARAAFYEFMASWSIYLRDPSHFGWKDILSTLPKPEIREYEVPITDLQREEMFAVLSKAGKGMFGDQRLGIQERGRLSQLAKGFLYLRGDAKHRAVRIDSHKPARVAEIVRAEQSAGLQTLVWTVFDEEGEIVAEQLAGLGGVAVLAGKHSEGERTRILERFRRGEVRVLISKAELLGYGLNFQFCRSMVFSGFNDSFEQMYQSIRRCYRFGQKEVVRVHVPFIPELEGLIFSNVKQKEARFIADVTACELEYAKVLGVKR